MKKILISIIVVLGLLIATPALAQVFKISQVISTSTVTTAGCVYSNGIGTSTLIASSTACVSSGTGTVNSSLAGRVAYYATNGTAVSGTSTIFIAPLQRVGISTTTPGFPFVVSGQGYFTSGVGIGAVPVAGSNLNVGSSITAGLNFLAGNKYTFVNDPVNTGIQLDGSNNLAVISGANITIQPTSGGDISLAPLSGGRVLIPSGVKFGVGSSTPIGVFVIKPAVNQIPFIVSSSTDAQLLTVIQNGNVGIGSSTPSKTLTVNGDLSLGGALYDTTLSPGTSGYILKSTGTSTLWIPATAGGGGSQWVSAAGILYNATSSDNVGIGTTTPQYKLTVAGNSFMTGGLAVNAAVPSAGNITAGSNIEAISNIIADLSFIGTKFGITGNTSNEYIQDSAGALLIHGDSGTNLTSTAGSNVTIAPTGGGITYFDTTAKVGIGSSTPSAFVSIKAPNTVSDSLAVASSTGPTIFNVSKNGNVGVASSTPSRTFTVVGDSYLSGKFYDTTNQAGSVGNVLLSTGTSTTWVATSSLGISGGGSSGTVTSVGLSSTNSTLTVGSSPVTTSGTITADLNLGHANTWTALQTFNNSLITNSASTTNLYVLGKLLDGGGSVGSSGQVLSSTGTSTAWVAQTGGGSGNSAWTIGTGAIWNATSTDNVGVGSTSPIATLSIKGSGSKNPFVVASSSNTQLFNILANGNVGINTSAPGRKLDVEGGDFIVNHDGADADNVLIGDPPGFSFPGVWFGVAATVPDYTNYNFLSDGAGGTIFGGSGQGGSGMQFRLGNNSYMGVQRTSGNVDIAFGGPGQLTDNGAHLDVSTSGAGGFFSVTSLSPGDKLLVDTTGKVGIGSTTPAALLGVNGGAYIAGNLTATGTINFTGLSTGCLQSTSGVISSTGSGCGAGGGGISGLGGWTFGSGAISNSTTTDKVGIGSTTPAAKLSVKANAGTIPVLVSSSTDATLFSIAGNGHQTVGGPAPTIISSDFGTPSINANSNDSAGSVTVDLFSTVTTMTFAIPWTATPSCVATGDSYVLAIPAISTSTIQFKTGGNTTVYYHCLLPTN